MLKSLTLDNPITKKAEFYSDTTYSLYEKDNDIRLNRRGIIFPQDIYLYYKAIYFFIYDKTELRFYNKALNV